MSTYAIGDVQGCYRELMTLLAHINFNENSDRLWFAGDLVNRGPESLQTLRFVKQLGNNAVSVLGNHDLHLLAVAHGKKTGSPRDSLDSILKADDCDELLDWLRHQYLLLTDDTLAYTLLHAGLAPQWTITQAGKLAGEVENIIRGDDFLSFLDVMYGDKPDQWDDSLDGDDRYRFIINVLTRMRYCDTAGRIALKAKGPPGSQPEPYLPWFTVPGRKSADDKILFGHWSTIYLGNIRDFQKYNVYPLDTGCLWGGKLSALRLEDETWFSVPSQQPAKLA
ncbi:MAG TPA: symmetrical bis(5'-nucleosyl)-tetraphosphatase [Gammaproteobacteria bacterium]|nr:symmetrical bis(5'-nucleosyl)-tetraphosphatase [Gammaproteobacteria bacterium]